MKAFRFPLEKVLAFRKTQKDIESARMQSLLSQRQKLTEDRLAATNADARETALLHAQPTVSGRDLTRYALARTSSSHWIRRLDLALAQLEQRIAQQRSSCQRAERDYELVLRLREKRFGEWKSELAREEEALSTEVYLARHIRERETEHCRTKPYRSPG